MRLTEVDDAPETPLLTIARRRLVLALVRHSAPLVVHIKQRERQIVTAVREHPDGKIGHLAIPRPLQHRHHGHAAGGDR